MGISLCYLLLCTMLWYNTRSSTRPIDFRRSDLVSYGMTLDGAELSFKFSREKQYAKNPRENMHSNFRQLSKQIFEFKDMIRPESSDIGDILMNINSGSIFYRFLS